MTLRIAIDSLGGDHAPGTIIDGSLTAARHMGLGLVLVGPEQMLRAELSRWDTAGVDVEILDAPDAVEMTDTPAAALRRKPRASAKAVRNAVAMASRFAAQHFLERIEMEIAAAVSQS